MSDDPEIEGHDKGIDQSIKVRDVSGMGIAIGDGATANVTIVKRSPEQERAERNRRAMLEVVKNTWVKGVLEKSLYCESLIDLGLEERPDAVMRPWDVQLQMPDQPNRVLPPSTPIAQVFDEAHGELLILGVPGAGKTTMLLELARDTIACAEQDASLPIPVVFNLSSWNDPKQTLAAWLVDELINKYHTPKKVAEGWVENGELLLLLDGLDEVKAECREACVQAINSFRQAHGLTMPLVVCSRISDYEALTTRLQLQGAVLLQPLTNRQIDSYFEHAGPQLATVRHAWQQDAELQELARQPLMLSIMTLAYRGITPESLADEQADSLEARRKHLFDAYIQQMFARVGRAKDERYTPEQTTRYLAWLAQRLIEQGQSVFLLENMRRSWLPNEQQRLPERLMRGLVVGLTLGGMFGVMFGFLFGLMGGLPSGVLSGLLGGLFGLMLGLWIGMDEKTKNHQERLTSSRKLAFLEMLRGRIDMYGKNLLERLKSSRRLAFLEVLWNEKSTNMYSENPTERLMWSWRSALSGLASGLMVGLVFGLVFGLGAVLVVRLRFGWPVGLTDVLVFGSLFGSLFGLLGGLLGGLQRAGMETKTIPNQGIQQSKKNGLVGGVLGLMACLVGGLVSGLGLGLVAGLGLVGGLQLGLSLGLVLELLFGLASGLGVGLTFGGSAVINHYTLRLLLYRDTHIPGNYERFLNYAVELLFLRRVGGSYVFVHRLLLEHFAALLPGQASPKKIPELARALPRPWKASLLLLLGLFIVLCGWSAYASLPDIYALRDLMAAQSAAITGNMAAQSGDAEGAMRDFAAATSLNPGNANYWNSYCWFGSLAGHAEEVLQACERAVNLAPDDGGIRDSRGLARALTGDTKGALEDFRFFVEWAKTQKNQEQSRVQREGWVVELEAGRNPFDEATLKALLK